MAHITLRNITKRFGAVTAVDGVSLDIASGEFVCLLGASGCGKTTLLRIMAGFTRPDSGEVLADGARVDLLPPSRREVGFVFQSYALFPTKSVADNIGFGLAVRHRPKAEIAQRVAELCDLTRLRGLEDRYPHELSGGQQQRVALARALAIQPSILLLDEPLSALDAKIRAHLRDEIRGVVDRLKVTTVYVTHDQEEALSIADRVAVMDAGRLLQVDAPMNIYLRPQQRFIAEFVGTSNMLPGRPLGETRVEVDGVQLEAPVPEALRAAAAVVVCIRPEHVTLRRDDGQAAGGKGIVAAISFTGPTVRAHVSLAGGQPLIVDVPTHEWLALGVRPDDLVTWSVRPGAPILLPAQNGHPV